MTLIIPALLMAALAVDGNVPAGNIVVEKIEGDTVFLHQDLRDTAQDWIYWKFRVTGAAERTLHFKFTKSPAVGSRSACVSTDRGKTWTWGDDLQPSKRREPKTNDHPDWMGFDWTFGPKDNEVWFCQTIPYDPADWQAFLDRCAHSTMRSARGTPLFETGFLCKTRKGRDIPYARFGRLDGKAKERIFLSSRHHCQEATATFVLEGILAQVFADDDLGAWLRETVEFRVVPFADYDGVVDGDQGKWRKPHDHARDYSDDRPVLYPEVRTIMAMLRTWNPTVVNDIHCPWLRSSWFEENSSNEFIYQVGLPGAEVAQRQFAFGKVLERVQTGGCGYRQSDDYWFGRGWNAGANYKQGKTLVQWSSGVFKDAKFISSWEIPFANQRFKTLRPADFRAFGRDVAQAYRAYLAPAPVCTAVESARVDVFANSFREGGWKLDVQFMDAMGSPYLLAHGLGSPVPDATATANVPETGAWRVYVRTRQWVKGAGRFQLLVNGSPLAKTFGAGSETWSWEDGGMVELKAGAVRLALRDLDGFDGRCAGVVLVKDGDAPTGPIAVTDRASEQDYDFDFVVVGGGLSGCCAAVAAARRGLKVALVQDRPVPGGNASGEVRVWSAGEIRYPLVRELRGEFMNMRYENNLSDSRRIAILEREPNLRCFYWHRAFGVEKLGAAISSVKTLDVMGNRVVRFRAPLFCDTTGDGWIGFWAGADWRYGREGQDETGEKYAPAKGDRQTLGSSIMWQSADTTGDAPFSAPWAEPYACGLVKTAGDWNWEFGLRQNILEEGEDVRDRILLAIYGAFSNAKKDPANAHRKLVTCPFILGKRETRRLMGDHIFCEKDVTEKTLFDDAVATGSWSVDLHYTIDEKIPFLTRCEQPHFGRYWIPYRSLYSRNVPNLFMAGRCFSCTHVGLGSPRVMNTLAQLGCAVGEAAAMCWKGGYTPRGLYTGGHARELQRNLGGSFPGNPDPATKGWLYIDDEDAAVTFEGPWRLGWNCNGGQLGDRTHFASGADAKATYPLPVKTKGRYRLKGLVPHLFHYQDTPVVRLTITSGGKMTTVDWNQLPESGTWRDLATLDLEPGATLVLEASPSKKSSAPVADGFALVPEG